MVIKIVHAVIWCTYKCKTWTKTVRQKENTIALYQGIRVQFHKYTTNTSDWAHAVGKANMMHSSREINAFSLVLQHCCRGDRHGILEINLICATTENVPVNTQKTFAAAFVSANLALKSNSIVGVVSTDFASAPDFKSRITSCTMLNSN